MAKTKKKTSKKGGKKFKRGEKFLYKYNKKLFKQLHPTKNEGIDLKKITCGSNKKLFWLCEKDHTFDATVNNRDNNGSDCPYCHGTKVCLDNCLATLNPKVAATWHPTLNGVLTPFDFTSGSDEKVYWLCEKGHISHSEIKSRKSGRECDTCNHNKNGTSDIERMFYYYLQLIFKKTINGYKVENKPKRDVEIDIFIPEINLGIEYDSYFYHEIKERKENDIFKNNFLNKKQIPLLRIRDKGLTKIHDTEIIHDHKSKNCLKNTLIEMINYICSNFKLDDEQIKKLEEVKNIDFDNYVIPKGFFEYPLKKNSLAKKNKKLAKQWHPTKNGGLKPEHISCGSHKKVYWLCDCGHTWKAIIKDRNNSPLCCCPKCEDKHNAKIHQKEVYQINIKTNKIIKTFISIKQAVEETGISTFNAPHIGEVCNGKRKTAGGFKWEFVKKPKKK